MTRRPPAPIRTARFTLIPGSRSLSRAAARDRAELADLLDATVPPGWPSRELDAALPVYAQQLENDPASVGWGLWFIVDEKRRSLVGDVGFKGKPDAYGRVEIGYGIAPAFRGRGYASEAATALVSWAFSQRDVRCISAECLADNEPSVRVLEKIGMDVVDKEGNMLKWELMRSS